jgi:DNA topoisomerase-1
MKKRPKLIIVESPAKIKTLSKFLGGDYIIKSTFGHIKDLPHQRLGVEYNSKTGEYELEYVPLDDKQKVIDDICKAAKGAEIVYLASDPDREGEIISWHIGEDIKKVLAKDAKMFRISFNEITKPAVTKAIENCSEVDLQKVQAQQARRILDRWVGYEVSPILWRKIRKGLSAGRVQSAVLLLICTRESEIFAFVPEESWSIQGDFKFDSTPLIAELAQVNKKALKLTNKEAADATLADVKKFKYSISDITVKARHKKPLPPFMTSTLQQAAFNKLGFSVDKTMLIAQKLYEGVPLADAATPEALITYMRTDSLRLSDTALDASRAYISKNFGEKYLPKAALTYSKKDAQDAHEAIRPINITITPAMAKKYLPKDQAALYELIWQRCVASQMTQAEYEQRQVSIEGGPYLFRLTGSTLIFDGFLKVYLDEEDEDDKNTTKIPLGVKTGLALALEKVAGKQHFTQPPPRYTEASIVKEMEKQGIGRPSTYVATISTLAKREYITKDKKRLTPTELGRSVTKMLSENLSDVINLEFTAHMEEDLDKIAEGKKERDAVLKTFHEKFEKDLKKFAGTTTKREPIKIDKKCPECQGDLVIRFGKSGEFIGCSKFPECHFTSNFTHDEKGHVELVAVSHEPITIKCPNCSKTLVQKVGRFGPFLACPGFPDCKYIHHETLKMKCPQDGGDITKRSWKKGTFWGCSNYPKCRFAIFGDVSEVPCPKCKSPYLLVAKNKSGTKTSCPNKECDFSKVEK